MRTPKQQGGFTIIEVILFLAITAFLLSLALIGTQSSIQNSRYTDSVRTTESSLQKQFSDILNGVNSRTDNLTCDSNGNVTAPGSGNGTDPGKTNCVLMGKLLRFTNNESEFRAYTVVGVEPNSLTPTDNLTDFQLVYTYRPHVVMVAGTEDVVEIPWQATIGGVKRSDNTAVNSIALLRSPRSSSILSYAFNWNGSSNITSAVTAQGNYLQNKTVNVCVKSADNDTLSAIKVGDGQGQAAVSTTFEVQNSACEES